MFGPIWLKNHSYGNFRIPNKAKVNVSKVDAIGKIDVEAWLKLNQSCFLMNQIKQSDKVLDG